MYTDQRSDSTQNLLIATNLTPKPTVVVSSSSVRCCLSELVCRLAFTQIACFPLILCSKAGLYNAHLKALHLPTMHSFGPSRLPQFYMGMLVGQARFNAASSSSLLKKKAYREHEDE